MMRGAMGPFPFTVAGLLKPLHPERENVTRMNVIESENGIRRMSIFLNMEFSSWAKQVTRRRGGFSEFSESMAYGRAEKYLKYGRGENCRFIVIWRLGNYT
jgi:hypothetical protein